MKENFIQAKIKIEKNEKNRPIQIISNKEDIIDIQIFNDEEKEKINNECKEFFSFQKEGEYTIKYYLKDEYSSCKALFSYCQILKEINLSNFNSENITDMSYMFNRCKNVTKINLSNFNTKNINKMIGMFQECENLKKMTSLILILKKLLI